MTICVKDIQQECDSDDGVSTWGVVTVEVASSDMLRELQATPIICEICQSMCHGYNDKT